MNPSDKEVKSGHTELVVSSDTPQRGRRNFLIGAGVGSVGAAAALVAGTTASTTAPKVVSEIDSANKGYRESEHIRRYYSTTRL